MAKTLTFGTVALAAALTGGLTVAAAIPAAAEPPAMEKCFGVSKPGENGCAHAKGLHACAAISAFTNDGGDWKMVPAGTCLKNDGSLTSFDGINAKKKG